MSSKPDLSPEGIRHCDHCDCEVICCNAGHGESSVCPGLPALTGTDPRVERITAALAEYDAALKRREHGGVAAGRFVDDARAALAAFDGEEA